MTDDHEHTRIAKLRDALLDHDPRAIGRAISLVENDDQSGRRLLAALADTPPHPCLIIGITGPPGAGKSTLTSSLVKTFRHRKKRVGIIAVDPSSPLSGGALLGDRIRMMSHALDPDVVARSMAARGNLGGLCVAAGGVLRIMMAAGCDIILVETVGIGQSEMDIIRLADLTLVVLAPGFGDDIQAMKSGILEVADLVVVNKADLAGSDRLLLDLQAGGDRSRRDRILLTEAKNHKGVEILADRIQDLGTTLARSGALSSRRKRAHDHETLNRALEILRPRLAASIRAQSTDEHSDPAIRAERVIDSLLKPDSSHERPKDTP